ncbi:MAG: tail fiber domain-containing protein, partial [Candidatus Omnitrophica bacterium]|nr:tail fiber domain-containing protein [Candidatus Omnitrophota bacterium]
GPAGVAGPSVVDTNTFFIGSDQDANEAGSSLQLGTDSSAIMTILESGDVGIGTIPDTPLSILGNGATKQVGITQNQVGGGSTMEFTTEDLDGDQATRLLFTGGVDSQNTQFFRGARGSEVETMRIDTAGDVGIGTTSPTGKLSVKAPPSSGVTDPNGGLRLEEDDNTTAWNLFYDTQNDNLVFRHSAESTDAMVIKQSNGLVGIGTSIPNTRLDLNGAARLRDTDLYFRGPNGGSNVDVGHGIGYYGIVTGLSKPFAGVDVDGPVVYGYSGGALGTRFNGSENIALRWTGGGVTVYGSFVNNSDRNAKEDVRDVENSEILDRLLTLPVSSWKYKDSVGRRHVGPMAQDFHAAFDALLDLKSDDKTIAPLDEAGVAFASIQALNDKLTNEIEAKNRKIESLKEANESLSERLERLEKLVLGNQ